MNEFNVIFFSLYLSKKMNVEDIYLKKVLPEKMKYNLEYLKKCNIFEDIKLCVKTVI